LFCGDREFGQRLTSKAWLRIPRFWKKNTFMREKVKVLVAGGASFIGSKKVYFGVLNCIRCGEAYAGC
jgi:L-lactate utilization protein LutB